MSNEETIFAEAMNKGSAERDAFLNQACAGNTHLRQAVDALLLAHDRAGGILESPAVPLELTTHISPASEVVGSTVGPYKLLEQIGGGGMGVVYMAEQLRPVRRKVALKIIKPGMDSGQVIARFEAERQALTMMDHPNIAKVLDAGTTDAGRPYFVMELVKGIPITDYCDQARLTTRQRLELFMIVCHAVQHAHQKGVIHRDLKPGNVLVTLHDDKPVPKVIDFGIAKAAGQVLTDKTLFTNYAQMLGTPLYMSPEQAQISGLDVDTRSDVYSLGVLLYELLTGTTPFNKQRLREAAYDEMRRIIREEDPPNPSTRLSTMGEQITLISAHRHTDPKHLSQLVHGELDWIVMKALEKDRTRRYETANGLARDVERHLHDEAVVACPPSARYRFRKFARRNKATLVAIALIVAALVLGTVISTWQAMRAREAERLAQTRLLAEEKARARAVAEAAKATAISNLLTEMLETASPNQKAGPEYSVRQLLDDFSGRLGDQLKDQPDVEVSIRMTLGNTYRLLALPKQAMPHFKAAIDLRRRLYGDDDLFLGDNLLNYAWVLRMDGDAAGAERYARQALAIYQKRDDAHRVLSAFSGILQFLIKQSKYVEAQAVGQEALAFARERKHEAKLGGILQALSTIKRVNGSPAEAEKLSGEALALQRSMPNASMTYPLLEHATNLSVQGKNAEAEPLLREALEYLRSHHFAEGHPTVIDVKARLGDLLQAKGDRAGLEALLPPLVVELDKTIAAAPHDLVNRMRRAAALRDLGDLDGAIAEYSEILARKPDHPGARSFRAALFVRQERYDKAVEDFTVRLNITPKAWWQWRERGHCYVIMEQWDKAEADFAKTIELNDTEYIHVGHSYHDAGNVLWKTRGLVPAVKACRKALEMKRQAVLHAPNDPTFPFHLTETSVTLQRMLKEQQQPAEAAKLHADCIAFFEKMAAQNPGQLAYRVELARFLSETGDQDAAYVQFSKILEVAPKRDDAWTGRAGISFGRQQWQSAIDDYSRAIELNPDVHTNWFHRGHAYINLSRWDEAAADFTKVVEKWGNDPEGWYQRGRVRAQQQRHAEAVADLRQAILLGLTDINRIKGDNSFASLRASDEYKKLLSDLAGGPKSPPTTSTQPATRSAHS